MNFNGLGMVFGACLIFWIFVVILLAHIWGGRDEQQSLVRNRQNSKICCCRNDYGNGNHDDRQSSIQVLLFLPEPLVSVGRSYGK